MKKEVKQLREFHLNHTTKRGEPVFPVTTTDAVFDKNGNKLSEIISDIEEQIGKGAKVFTLVYNKALDIIEGYEYKGEAIEDAYAHHKAGELVVMKVIDHEDFEEETYQEHLLYLLKVKRDDELKMLEFQNIIIEEISEKSEYALLTVNAYSDSDFEYVSTPIKDLVISSFTDGGYPPISKGFIFRMKSIPLEEGTVQFTEAVDEDDAAEAGIDYPTVEAKVTTTTPFFPGTVITYPAYGTMSYSCIVDHIEGDEKLFLRAISDDKIIAGVKGCIRTIETGTSLESKTEYEIYDVETENVVNLDTFTHTIKPGSIILFESPYDNYYRLQVNRVLLDVNDNSVNGLELSYFGLSTTKELPMSEYIFKSRPSFTSIKVFITYRYRQTPPSIEIEARYDVPFKD